MDSITSVKLQGELLKNIPSTLLKDVVLQVLKFLEQKLPSVEVDTLWKQGRLGEADGWSQEKLQAIVNIITSLLRLAIKANMTLEELQEYLKKKPYLDDELVELITSVWKESRSQEVVTTECVDIGQLVDFQWKVGVSISSDKNKNLNNPFVILMLKVALPGGETTSKCVEMSLLEFQNFQEQLKEMSSVLSTV